MKYTRRFYFVCIGIRSIYSGVRIVQGQIRLSHSAVFTPVVWTKIRRIKGGNTTQRIPAILDQNNQVTTNSQEIANILGEHYYRRTLNHTSQPISEQATTSAFHSPINQPFTT